jgi:hypothetical protein
MNFSRHDYTIAEHFLPALINGDCSGLEDDEETALKIFTDNAYNTHGLGFWDTNPSEQPDFMRCEVTDLLANCHNITYYTERK